MVEVAKQFLRRSRPWLIAALLLICVCAIGLLWFGGLPSWNLVHISAGAVVAALLTVGIIGLTTRPTITEPDSDLVLQAAALSAAANAIFITDARGRILWLNDSFMRVTGFSAAEVLGKTPSFLRSGHHDAAFFNAMWQTITAGKVWQAETVNRHKDGTLMVVNQTVSPIRRDGNKITHFVAVHEDITAMRAAEARAHYLAEHDPLTGLLNREAFELLLRRGLERAATKQSRALLLHIDLDHLRELNDTLGLVVGDAIIKEVGQRLAMMLPTGGVAARLGGDEFALFVDGLDYPESVLPATDAIIERLCQIYEVMGHQVGLTVRTGAAIFPLDGQTAAELMQAAEIALDRAKQRAPGELVFFEAALSEEMHRRVLVSRALKETLASGHGLQVFYQPQAAMDGQTLIGAEALVRWTHPELGVISPAEFVPIAEVTGQIHALDQWVLTQVCREQRKRLDRGVVNPPPVAVNMSAVDLQQPDFAGRLLALVQSYGLDATVIQLELTESALIEQLNIVTGNLQHLQSAGFKVAIDDFGTGYSSLSYLSRMPLQKLKIDRSFVTGVDTGGHTQAIARSVVSLGHALGLRVLAEGVETEAQRLALAQLGCDEIQGYLYARPMPAADYDAFIQQHHIAAQI